MGHNRELVMGSADLVLKLRLKVRDNLTVIAEVRDKLEQVMISAGYMGSAPFKFVSLMLRYGLKNEDEPHYQRISKKYSDLPLAIELDAHELRDADREEFKRLLSIATLKSLIHAGKKYELPTQVLADRLAQLLAEETLDP